MNARHRALSGVLLTILLAGTACAGKTVVLESPPVAQPVGAHTSDGAEAPSPDVSSQHPTDSGTTPSADPEPSEPAPEPDGWWPPAASPTPPKTRSDDPTQPPSHEPGGEKGSEPEEPTEEKSLGPDRFTFPDWQEHIYDSRNGDGPEQFRSRERFVSCGDFASEAGAHVISPDVAACLDEGKHGTGKESAIAVRMSEENVHVWFVRVGPGRSEYFVDRSREGGKWVHAACETEEPIGLLACEEPTDLDGGQYASEDPGESPSPAPGQSATPAETPKESRTTVDEEPEQEDAP